MRRLLLLAAMVALGAHAAGAQVRQLQTGQSLDANYQVGSGGYNTVNGGQGGVNSQLGASGQVTGLGSFHGNTAYSGNDQLRTNLGTSGFDTFMRQSVGMVDAMTSQTYLATPYTGSGAIPQLQNLARGDIGTMNFRRQIDPGVQKLYTSATADYAGLGLNAPVGTVTIGNSQKNVDNFYRLATPDVTGYQAAPAPQFGAPSSVRDALVKEFKQIDAQAGKPIDASVDAAVDGRAAQDKLVDVIGDPGKRPSPTSGPSEAGDMANAQRPARHLSTPAGPNAGGNGPVSGYERDGVLYPKANQDVFVDLLVNLQSKRNMATESDVHVERPIAPAGDKSAGGPAEKPAKPKYAVEINPDKTIMLHGFAGSSDNMFNAQMRKAQAKLGAGKYYESAGEFETACVMDMANPMARLGAGLAIFAAGEPFSAALHVRRGLQTFPPIMETRLDVKGMMNPKVFSAQLDDLDKRLTGPEKDNVELLLLGTYLHYAAGQDSQAKAYAQNLKALSKGDKLVQSYAEFVLTGKRPAYQKDLAGK